MNSSDAFQYEHKNPKKGGKRLSRFSVMSYTESNLKRLNIGELFRMAYGHRGLKKVLIDFILKAKGIKK